MGFKVNVSLETSFAIIMSRRQVNYFLTKSIFSDNVLCSIALAPDGILYNFTLRQP